MFAHTIMMVCAFIVQNFFTILCNHHIMVNMF